MAKAQTASHAGPFTSVSASHLVAALAASIVLALAYTPALAQTRYVRVTGWIQWIAGERLVLALDDGSGVVPVDLTRVPLDEYRTLGGRDQVMVTGVPSDDNRAVLGLSIVPLPDRGVGQLP